MKRLAALGLILALLASCRAEAPAKLTQGAADSSEPRAGGTLFRRLESPLASLNPVLVGSRYDTYVHRYLFTPLIDLSADLQPIPALAESWDISEDKREYTFHLNKTATFSDRTPVRAADVLFTLRKIVDPTSDAIALLTYFEQLDLPKCRVIDDKTVVVAFREAMSPQLLSFANVFVIPEHVYSQGSFPNDFNDKAIGSGPYVLARYERGKEVVMRRREDYWSTKPLIDVVHFKMITDNTTAWNAAKLGEIDETMIQTEIWDRERNNARTKRTIEFLQYYQLSYNCVIWNTRRPQFADKRLRQALARCMNLSAVVTGLYKGTARVMNGHFLPEQPGFNAQVRPIQYDLEAARHELTSLGWLDTNGDGILDRQGQPLSFEFMITGGSSASTIAQMFQSDLKKAGIDMRIAVIDFAAAQQRMLRGNFDATYLSWDLDPDPDPYALFHSSQMPPRGQNYAFYSNPETDRLIEAARKEFDAGKRKQIYEQLHARLAEDQPYMWIVQPALKWAINRRVRGAKIGAGYGLFLWYPGELEWWLADAKPAAQPRS